MLDRERIVGKLAELDGYLEELRSVAPARFEDYRLPQRRRATERLLQISVEAVLEICHLLVSGLRLGIPAEENDLIDKLAHAGVVTEAHARTLKEMRGFRNILVHKYGTVDDEIVFRAATSRIGDFDRFRAATLEALKRSEEPSG